LFDFGTDSLGRDLLYILIESSGTSILLGLIVALIVTTFLIVSLYGVTRKSYPSVFSVLMLIDHIIPKYLLLLLFVSLFNNWGFFGFSLILGLFFSLSSATQLFSFLNKNYSEELRMIHISSGLKVSTLVFFELMPIAKVLFIQNIASSFIQSIILESILTLLGVGLKFGTPSLGFLLTDGIQSLHRNPFEFIISLFFIVILSILTSVFLYSDK